MERSASGRPAPHRRFSPGWASGALSVALGALGFGALLCLWFPSLLTTPDRLFGTHYLPARDWPAAYGIAGDPVPDGYLRQLAFPFRP